MTLEQAPEGLNELNPSHYVLRWSRYFIKLSIKCSATVSKTTERTTHCLVSALTGLTGSQFRTSRHFCSMLNNFTFSARTVWPIGVLYSIKKKHLTLKQLLKTKPCNRANPQTVFCQCVDEGIASLQPMYPIQAGPLEKCLPFLW